jgi:hypothetical protein
MALLTRMFSASVGWRSQVVRKTCGLDAEEVGGRVAGEAVDLPVLRSEVGSESEAGDAG